MSISSSIDYESSRTSTDSTYSTNAKIDFAATRAPMPRQAISNGRRSLTEPVVPAYARYGAGARAVSPVQTTLMTPRRLSRGPPGAYKSDFIWSEIYTESARRGLQEVAGGAAAGNNGRAQEGTS